MSLGNEQRDFTKLIGKLIEFIYAKGYAATFGDAYRDPRVFGGMGTKIGYGHPSSNHKRRLAVDFNLFKDGVFLQGTEDHRMFGEFWEGLDSRCRWGGRFDDGNHYEFNIKW